MPWFHGIAEATHAIQNPTSAAKIELLGERLGLTRGSHLLDAASGRGGPALVLAERFGCRITALERDETFHAAAVERARERGLQPLVDFVQADAADADFQTESFDAALCLGASFIWGGLDEALAALQPAVRAGGHVVVGEPYWRRWPVPAEALLQYPDFVTLAATAERFERADLPVVGLIAASEDDWDRYETLHWQSLERWLAANPGDPDAPMLATQHGARRETYLRWQRDLLGWAMLVGWKG